MFEWGLTHLGNRHTCGHCAVDTGQERILFFFFQNIVLDTYFFRFPWSVISSLLSLYHFYPLHESYRNRDLCTVVPATDYIEFEFVFDHGFSQLHWAHHRGYLNATCRHSDDRDADHGQFRCHLKRSYAALIVATDCSRLCGHIPLMSHLAFATGCGAGKQDR